MKTLLREAGREFLKAFGAALVILMPGVLAATNLDQFYALGVAALGSAFAGGFKAIQVFVPALSFAEFVPQPVAAWLDAFTRAALGFFLVFAVDFMNAPNYSEWKSAVVGALIGAAAAGFRALEGLLTKGETPVKGFGVA